MPLAFRYVRSLAEVVDPAVRFLTSRPLDLFARQHLVVPTAGAKAWLAEALARRLGASSEGCGDGILANVPFAYSGTLARLLEPSGADGHVDASPGHPATHRGDASAG